MASEASLSLVLPHLPVVAPEPESPLFEEIILNDPLLYPQEMEEAPEFPLDIFPGAESATTAGWDPDEDMDLAPFRLANRVQWTAQSRVNGGAGAAWAVSASTKPATPFIGGMADGMAKTANDIVPVPAYHGGMGDGHSASAMPIIYSSVYLGGLADGHSTASMPIIYSSVYLGGLGDGHATASMPIVYTPVFLGGFGDGHSTASMPMIYSSVYLGAWAMAIIRLPCRIRLRWPIWEAWAMDTAWPQCLKCLLRNSWVVLPMVIMRHPCPIVRDLPL
ncbi:MAG: hypothetical protein K2O66_07090 [Bacteroidales bacterium]|nr:hypothetical protein [Bacteroidales bacterium]